MVLYAMGFYAMLLGNVLFLTGVWHYSIMKAGLAITPGPLVVAAVSGPAGRLATRVGFRAVLVTGAALLASGLIWYATRVGLHPAYLTEWLPATIVTGLGIGLTFPVLSAAAVSSLPGRPFRGRRARSTRRPARSAARSGSPSWSWSSGRPPPPGWPWTTSTTSGCSRPTMSALSGSVALLLAAPTGRSPGVSEPGRLGGACSGSPPPADPGHRPALHPAGAAYAAAANRGGDRSDHGRRRPYPPSRRSDPGPGR